MLDISWSSWDEPGINDGCFGEVPPRWTSSTPADLSWDRCFSSGLNNPPTIPLNFYGKKNRQVVKLYKMVVSWNGGTPKSPIFNGIFHYKPMVLISPFMETSKSPPAFPQKKPRFFVKSPGFSPDGWNPVRCPSQLHVQNPQGNIHQGHEDQNPGRTDSEGTPRMVPSRMKHSSLCFFKHAIYRYIYIYICIYIYIDICMYIYMYIILYSIKLYYIILYYIKSYYTILYYIVLYYIILY